MDEMSNIGSEHLFQEHKLEWPLGPQVGHDSFLFPLLQAGTERRGFL